MALMPLQAIREATKRFISGRAGAYRRALDPANRDGETILRDLAKFCRAHESTAHPDPHMAARLDGRREVWLRIQQNLNFPDDQLWLLYGGPQMKGD